MELNNHQFLKPLVLLAALKQFEYQATNRLLLAALEEYGDSGTTQKKDVKKTPATMIPSTLSRHCMCTINTINTSSVELPAGGVRTWYE